MASYRSSTPSVASGIFMILFGGFFAIVGLSFLVTQLLAGSDIISALFTLVFPVFGFFTVYMGAREIKKAKRSNAFNDHASVGESSDPEVRCPPDHNSDDHSIELFIGIMFTFIGTLATITVLSSGGGFVALFTLIFVIVGVILLVSSVKNIKKSKNSGTGYVNDQHHENATKLSSATNAYENSVFKDNPNANGRYESDQRVPDTDVSAFGSRGSRKKESSNGVYTYFNCPSCGSLNESGSKACRNCGKRF